LKDTKSIKNILNDKDELIDLATASTTNSIPTMSLSDLDFNF